MSDSELLALIRSRTREVPGRVEIDCEAALALAARSGRSPGEIGKLCNDNAIRICACQLGCFP
jgi:hypothetical protein